MSPFGVPMIGWVWAGGALATGGVWVRDRWRSRSGRAGEARVACARHGDPASARPASLLPSQADRQQLRRIRPAPREGGDAVEVLCRMYGRDRP